jgi:hypothetical protein
MSNSFPLPISVSDVHLLCNMKQSDTNPSFPKDTSISVLPLAKESTEQPLHSLKYMSYSPVSYNLINCHLPKFLETRQ